MQNPGKHVDQRGDVLAPRLTAAAARLLDQGLDARNVAQPELDESQRQEIFRIVGIELESLLEQPQRRFRVGRQDERALMAQRRGGLARRTPSLGALGSAISAKISLAGALSPDLSLARARRAGLVFARVEGEHGLGDQTT